jgi:hypothetical protein
MVGSDEEREGREGEGDEEKRGGCELRKQEVRSAKYATFRIVYVTHS